MEACGVCGADAGDIERADSSRGPPHVPGHEVIGHIAAIGPNVPNRWAIGQRVGVGRLGGHCLECSQCRQGLFQLCENQPIVGSSRDGGYAEFMLARATGLVAVPDELASEEAAPLLCAGIATFNALKKCGAEAGDTVAIYGIGGLGHMALQYARNMGFRVVAIGRGKDIAEDVLRLGAHVYIDTFEQNAVAQLKSMGGAKAIVSTVNHPETVSLLPGGLTPNGRLVLLGAGKDPLAVSPGQLVGGERSIVGSITGTPYEIERALDFSVLSGARPMFQTMLLESANDAYRFLKSGAAKYRIVLKIKEDRNAHQS